MLSPVISQIAPSTHQSAALLKDSDSDPRIPEYRSLALRPSEDDPNIRIKHRPFILSDDASDDWVNKLELSTAMAMAETNLRLTNQRLRVLVLYGSLRRRSYSRLVAFEASRILFRLGCDVRIFDPEGLPIKNDTDHTHPKVQELRELSRWSDGHIWVSPEQHGNLVSSAMTGGSAPDTDPSLSFSTFNLVAVLTLALDSGFQEPDRLDPP